MLNFLMPETFENTAAGEELRRPDISTQLKKIYPRSESFDNAYGENSTVPLGDAIKDCLNDSSNSFTIHYKYDKKCIFTVVAHKLLDENQDEENCILHTEESLRECGYVLDKKVVIKEKRQEGVQEEYKNIVSEILSDSLSEVIFVSHKKENGELEVSVYTTSNKENWLATSLYERSRSMSERLRNHIMVCYWENSKENAVSEVLSSLKEYNMSDQDALQFIIGMNLEPDLMVSSLQKLLDLVTTDQAVNKIVECICASSTDVASFTNSINEVHSKLFGVIESRNQYIKNKISFLTEKFNVLSNRIANIIKIEKLKIKKEVEGSRGVESEKRSQAILDKESVGRILSYLKDSDNSQLDIEPNQIDEYERDGIKQAEHFYQIIRGVDSETKHLNSEELLVKASLIEIESLGESADTRQMLTQLLGFHYLVFSGELDKKYQEIIARKEDLLVQSDEVAIKTEIAYSFLKSIILKNAEESRKSLESESVSTGVEVEYEGFLHKESRTREIFQRFVAEMMKMANNASNKKDKQTYLKFAENAIKKLRIYKKVTKLNEDQDEVHRNFLRWEPSVGFGQKIGLYKEGTGSNTIQETVTKPSLDYKTQIRELIHSSKLGGLWGDWGVHETFSGVKLDEDNTEFMYGLPLSAAAGFVDFPKMSEQDFFDTFGGYASFTEKYKKTASGHSVSDDKYFPFHKYRKNSLDAVTGSSFNFGIELRSMPGFGKDKFISFVRQFSFQYYFAQCVRSHQLDDSQRTSMDKELDSAYTNLISSWENLLQSTAKEIGHDIDLKIPTGTDMYTSPEDFYRATDDVDIVEKNRYSVFLSQMVFLAQNHGSFSSDVRKIISDFRSKVKQTLANSTKKNS